MPDKLEARHGDTWHSPRWAVAVAGQPVDLTQWYVRAQARQTPDTAPLYQWVTGDAGLVIGTADIRLASGTVITTSTVQLRLAPADWAGLPRKWAGLVEVDMASDDTDTPADRRTIVPARKLTVVPDVSYV